ncbi:hypothetical protein AADG42_14970 [Ammonicoccus fulvus]|uniref:TolA protein n=1 Tax=Ammonicoccus fulvus TaxID=3138240 RepID=A0ABZ3FR50_9ACTN
MSFLDKIKDTLSGNKDEKAAEAAKQAEQAAQQQRDEAEAREAADRDAEKQREAAAEAERVAAEQRAAEEQAAEERRIADERAAEEARAAEQRAAEEARAAEQRAAEEAAVPGLSVGRVREIVAHDSNPNTPTGQGLDKEAGMVLESALRRALDQLGLPNRNTDDGSLGTLFLESYSRWQGHLGYSGNDADGVPGRESLTKLAEFTGAFRVVD